MNAQRIVFDASNKKFRFVYNTSDNQRQQADIHLHNKRQSMVNEKTDEKTVKADDFNDELKLPRNDSHNGSVSNDDSYKKGNHSFFDPNNVLEIAAQDSYDEFSDDVDDDFDNISEVSAAEDSKAADDETLEEPTRQDNKEDINAEVDTKELDGLKDKTASKSEDDEAATAEEHVDQPILENSSKLKHTEDQTPEENEKKKIVDDDVSKTDHDLPISTEKPEVLNEKKPDEPEAKPSLDRIGVNETESKDEKASMEEKLYDSEKESVSSASSSESDTNAFSYDPQSANSRNNEINSESVLLEKDTSKHLEDPLRKSSTGPQTPFKEEEIGLKGDIPITMQQAENPEKTETDEKMKDLSITSKEPQTPALESVETEDYLPQATSSTLFVNSASRIDASEHITKNHESMSFPASANVNISSPQLTKDAFKDNTEDELPSFVLDPASDTANLNGDISRQKFDTRLGSHEGTKIDGNGDVLGPHEERSRGRYDSFYTRATSPVSSAISWFNSKRGDLSPENSVASTFYLEEILEKNASSIDESRKKKIISFLESERNMIPSDIYNLLLEFIENPLEVLKEKSEKIQCLIFSHEVQAAHTVLWKSISAWCSFDCEQEYFDLQKKSCESDKAICKDLDRTFPPETLERFFSNRGQKSPDTVADSIANLHRVLRSLANAVPEVGYTQGMSWIAGSLLMYLPPPQAFSMLVLLFKEYHLQSIFCPELKGLGRIMHQFTRLVEDFMPALAVHLKKNEIETCSYASEWFLTLFAYKFPLDVVAKIYDILLFYGSTILLNIGLGLLKNSEKSLLQLNNDELITYLKDNIFSSFMLNDGTEQYDTNKVLQFAFTFQTSKSAIDTYGNEYDTLLKTQKEVDVQLENTKSTNKSLNDHFSTLNETMSKLHAEHESMNSMLLREKLVLKQQAKEQSEMESRITSLHAELSKIKTDVEGSFQGEMEAIIAENLKIMSEGQVLEDELFKKEKKLAETKVNLATLDGEHMMAVQRWSQLMSRINKG
ncbi:GTPase activating protein Gyp51 [Schizosaccharomyces octosporus yFS286]|uniref:GTPase activating protein Gyp51 n=1 Tax=Schizosaccharomyces octosporus (strain yFS286) TaxID=483514 RepID=S9R4L4_SCHOY|nr:GTPase activating protein Gyp51 [Schizosaccharomyces octosporus yFS286]EPX73290.1 GTPase activating protein Gyp51 [Schizosaccharomyces octosporus yFS286]